MNPEDLAGDGQLIPLEDQLRELVPPGSAAIDRGIGRGQSLQRTQVGYTTALRVAEPRDRGAVWALAKVDARLMKEDAWYSLPFGGRKVEGPTAALAYALLGAWGNAAAEVELIDERKDGTVLLQCTYVDLETGVNIRRPYLGFIRPAPKNFARSAEERARWRSMQLEGQYSRAARGIILRGLPAWLTNEAVKEARKAAASDLLKGRSLDEARALVVKAFSALGVPEQDLVGWMGRPTAQWTDEDCAETSAVYKAIKRGECTVDEVFADVLEARRIDNAPTGRDALGLGKQHDVSMGGPGPDRGEMPPARRGPDVRETTTTTMGAEPTEIEAAGSATATATATAKAKGPPRAECPICGKSITLTQAGVFRHHKHGPDVCDGTGHKPMEAGETPTATASTTTATTSTETATAEQPSEAPPLDGDDDLPFGEE